MTKRDPNLRILAKDHYGTGHTINISRLRGGWVLDAGCRDYRFTTEIVALGCKVIALDIDRTALRKNTKSVISLHAALLAKWRKKVIVITPRDVEGTFVFEPRYPLRKQDKQHEPQVVPATTLKMLMRTYHISFFDVVKLDIEGSEFDILAQWPGPIADQIQVEFHDTEPGRNPLVGNPELYYDKVLSHLGQWYEVVKHKMSGPMWFRRHYDSLFVLKGACSEKTG